MKQSIVICDECGSEYYQSASKMANLCPECSSILYGYENCAHEFENGRCVKCFWDRRASSYLNQCDSKIVNNDCSRKGIKDAEII